MIIKSIQFLAILLSLLAGTTRGGDDGRCPHVPSMTAEQACSAVCGTRRMHRLCLRTLLLRRRPGHGHSAAAAAAPVTYYAGVAARGALGSYDATAAAAKRATLYRSGAGAVPTGERAAYAGCVDGYEAARRSMRRVADDLLMLAAARSSCEGAAAARSSCEGAAAANLARDYTGGLRGMDACRKSLLSYPASPLYGRNLADRNKTLLAALLCSLVPRPPEGRGGVHA